MSNKEIKVFQWNVLTQAFCNWRSYPKSDYTEEALAEDGRYKKLLSRIEAAMDEDRIIVLHEVDYKLRGLLTVLAESEQYAMVSQGHGYWRNWYMGSVVLWPRWKFDLNKVKWVTVGDLVKKNVDDPTPEPGMIEWAMSPFMRGYRWVTGAKAPTNYYRKAVGRSNVLTHVQLTSKKSEETVNVWAYHMPCAFRDPPIMQYHADEIVRAVFAADEGRHVLCMDGNFKPHTPIYNTFSGTGMTSVAFAALGKEPSWTCRSNSNFGGSFEGTLDYVWFIDTTFEGAAASVSDHQPPSYGATFADLHFKEEQSYLPTETFPSDHLWMDVSISFEREEKS